jgi:putative metallohydrolase (TIGR04338 family)
VAATLGERQAALYAAEEEALAGLGLRWRRLPEAQAYVDGLVASAWFGDRWPHCVQVTVERRGRGAVWSTCQGLDGDGPGGRPTEGVVFVAGPLRQPVVLHELAHLLAPPGAGHGPVFAETMLSLVHHEMGLTAFADYLHALRRCPGFASVRDLTILPTPAR